MPALATDRKRQPDGRHRVEGKHTILRIHLEQGAEPSSELVANVERVHDIRRAVRADHDAWSNFQRLPDRYVRIRVGYIEGARDRPEEFRKRLDHFVRMTAANRRFGYGGIEGYFEDG